MEQTCRTALPVRRRAADRPLTDAVASRKCTDPRGSVAPLALEFRILGPLEVRDGDNVLHLGGTKQRGVLALLLLHANEVVSSDRLVEELWGGTPPEDAPTALQAHVSRLRKAIPAGPAVLVTKAPGYVLLVPDDQLDLGRFRLLAATGREALDRGDAATAASSLREALGLWRGRPLADLADEPYAREATADLEDAWLEVVEIRVEADLALGRHAELASELRALVRAHPLRERMRGQLMLSLYRAGRQAEALEVYADGRRALVEELGLEPGPELQRLQQAILEHATELAVVALPVAESRTRRHRGPLLGVAVALALAASIAVAVIASQAGSPPAENRGGLLFAIDADSGEVVRRLAVGVTPTAVSVGQGAVWVLDADRRTVSRIEPGEGTVDTFATGATPTDLVAGAQALWVGNGRRLTGAQFIGPVAVSVARIEPGSRTERAEVTLPRDGGAVSNLVDNHLAARAGAVWAVAPDFSIARIDETSSTVTSVGRPFPVVAVAAGKGGVWALGSDGAVARIDERSGQIEAQARVPSTSVAGIAVGADEAWVTSPSDGTLWRVAFLPEPALGSVDIGFGATDIAVAGDSVWVVNPLQGTLTEVSRKTTAVVRTVALGGVPRSLAVDGDRVWVAVSNAATTAVDTGDRTSGVRALPAGSCEPVVSGGGDADVLIASDLALQGGTRVVTTQMAQAISFVLRRHSFRAGRFRVAYQSCDDSIATTGLFDEGKCAANARSYAANPDVIGVIGTFNSPCAATEIPILNRAPGGGLAMISPTNSFVGLTRAAPGVPDDLLGRLYPTGRRNYLRVYPTDDIQMAALALVAREKGWMRVALLDDGEPGYGGLLAASFERAAARLGIEIVLREQWDPRARSYAGLAAAVARAEVGAVVLSGLLDTNGAQVVSNLRARLERDVGLLAPDGFTPVGLLLEKASDAARGMLVSLGGLTLERLSPAGRDFVTAFAATQPGVEIRPSTVYAAQATEVLLSAVSRSDGSRASVLRELFRLKVTGGLLGSFAFDRSGDITESPITIVRAERAGGSGTVQSVEGASIHRVVRPDPLLVR